MVLALGATSACSSAGEGAIGEGASALKRQDIDPREPRILRDAGAPDAAPPPPPTVAPYYPLPPLLVQDSPMCTPSANPPTWVLRRRLSAPTCLAIPGLTTAPDGTRSVAAPDGRYRVEILPVAASAPEGLRERSCKVVFERACQAPSGPGSNPHDVLQLASNETLTRVDWAFLGGIGHCDVCGYASGRHLWAVLPWEYYSFQVGDFQYTGEASSGAAVVDVELPFEVPPGDVAILRGHVFH